MEIFLFLTRKCKSILLFKILVYKYGEYKKKMQTKLFLFLHKSNWTGYVSQQCTSICLIEEFREIKS